MVICAIYDICLTQTNNAVIQFRLDVNICMLMLKYTPDFYNCLPKLPFSEHALLNHEDACLFLLEVYIHMHKSM